MGRVASQEFAKSVVHFHQTFSGGDIKKTVAHFRVEGKFPQSIRKIVNRFKKTGKVNFKKTGPPPMQVTHPKIVKVKRKFEKNPNLSTRVAAKELNISQTTLSRIKVHKLGIKARTKKDAPKQTDEQEERSKKNCTKIYKKCLKKVLVIDDETYVHHDPMDVPGRKFFHCVNSKEVTFEQMFKKKAKFLKKYLIWQAMDESVTFRTLMFRRAQLMNAFTWRNV